jgi:hypothetical protein
MKLMEKLANDYNRNCVNSTIEHAFFAGFEKSRELIIKELMNIYAQTDDPRMYPLAEIFGKIGEEEI